MRARAYVDGFNLYRSLLIANPDLKWLNFEALWPAAFPDIPVEKTCYFTALVHALPLDRGPPARQRKYLDALASTAITDIILGKFHQDVVVARPLNGSPRDRIEVHRTREKRSDVNLASHLLRDSYAGDIDTAIVVTNDSDLTVPISFVVAAGVHVILCSPTAKPSADLARVASERYVLAKAWLAAAQFPSIVTLAGGKQTHRPREWR